MAVESIDETLGTATFRGVLLGAAVGSALGAGEDRPRRSEDTRLMLAAARSLLARGGFHGDHMAEALAAEYEHTRDFHPDRSKVSPGEHLEEEARHQFGGDGSFGSGAALRMAPVGLLYFRDPARAGEVARLAARITHDHPLGQDGAALQAAALATVVGLSGAPLDRGLVLSSLREHVWTRRFKDILGTLTGMGEAATPAEIAEVLGNGAEAHRSVATALDIFLRAGEDLGRTVALIRQVGGELGVIGALVGALAGARVGETGIPGDLRGSIEGPGEIVEVADALLSLATRRA